VAEGRQHRFLTAHGCIDGTLVEYVTPNDRQLRMVDLKP
jgi:hypothetical protein